LRTIRVPPKLVFGTVFGLCLQVEDAKGEDILKIDFQDLEFCSPFGALVAIARIGDVMQARITAGLPASAINVNTGVNSHGYLAHIGFFKSVGLSLGDELGANPSTLYCMPVQKISRSMVVNKAGDVDAPIGKGVESISMDLARMILGESGPMLGHPVSYCFTEIIRNVFEHSGADECWVCGQRYKGNVLEIAIVDKGMGIRNSLLPKYPHILSDKAALALAIQPGVTKVFDEKIGSGYYDNSGFGLYVISELAKERGDFFLCSGTEALNIGQGKYTFSSGKFSGTAIRLWLKKEDRDRPEEILKNILLRGQEISKLLGRPRPSGSTWSNF
jgi:hypothetical protein